MDPVNPLRPRRCSNWLASYLDMTIHQESPEEFHLWTALSIIATTVGRAVHMERGFYNLYPNLYVVLVAGSARCRKSSAIRIGRRILNTFGDDIEIFSQKMTPEAVISRLKECHKARLEGFPKESAVMLFVPELATFLTVDSYHNGMIALLTDIYDCDEDFKYETKARGMERIISPCVNWLGATTEDWLKESIPIQAIGGGLTSRMIFIYRKTTDRSDLWSVLTEKEIKLQEDLCYDLQTIRHLTGKVLFTGDAKAWMENWYNTNQKKQREQALDGYYGRRHDLLFKIAILMSIAERSNLLIEVQDLVRADTILLKMEENLPYLVIRILANQTGEELELVLKIVRNSPNHIIDRSALLKKICHRMTAEQLNIVMETLVQQNSIEQIIVPGGKTHYKLSKSEETIENG